MSRTSATGADAPYALLERAQVRFPISYKFAMALGLLAVSMIAAGISSVAVLRFNERSLAELQQRRLKSLLLVRDSESALRRYIKDVEVAVSTKDEDVLKADEPLLAEIHAAMLEFRQLNGTPAAAFDRKLTQFANQCDEYVRRTEKRDMDSPDFQIGKDASDLRIQLIGEMQALELDAKRSFESDVERIGSFNKSSTQLSMLFTTILTVLAVGLSGAILVAVLRRIQNITEHFADTDLEKITPLISNARRRDELEDLTDAANRMLMGMRESRQQLVDKALLDSVLKALVDLLVVVDEKGTVVRVNDACERLLGAIPGGHEGRPFLDWLKADERTGGLDLKALIANVSAGMTITVDLSLKTTSGTLIPVQLVGTQLPANHAEGNGAVFVARDLRTKLTNDQEMRLVQAQLVQASKLAALGTLGAGVAHELNNPLAAVRGYAELIANSPAVPELSRGLAAKIIKAAERMRKITDHLRAFSADTTKLEKRSLDLNTIVQDSLILLQNQLQSSGVSVSVDLAAILPQIYGDANQLESIVQNLITNARDALMDCKDGRKRHISVATVLTPAKWVAVTVEDNASGIPAHIQPRVFDPFFTTKEVGKGTGLGLSIAHGIAKDHGGKLAFTTHDGVGTKFTASFPLTDKSLITDTVVTAGPVKLHPGVLGPKPILVIIDDEPDIGEVLSMFLEKDFAVEVYDEPNAALARLRQKPFDLVVTDMKMPQMSGIDVIRDVKSHAPDAKILVVSGHARTESDIVVALAEGAIGVIPKPFPGVEELRELLRDAMAGNSQVQLAKAN